MRLSHSQNLPRRICFLLAPISILLTFYVSIISYAGPNTDGIEGKIRINSSSRELLAEALNETDGLREGFRIRVLPMIAQAQVMTGDKTSGRTTFQLAKRLILSVPRNTGGFQDRESQMIQRLAELAVLQRAAEMPEEMTHTFQEAVRSASGISDRGAKLLAYKDIAVFQARAKQNDSVTNTLARIDQEATPSDQLIKVEAAKAVAETYLVGGNKSLAEFYRDRTVELAAVSLRDQSHSEARRAALLAIARLHACMGDINAMKAALLELQTTTVAQSENIRDALSLITVLLDYRHTEAALGLLDQVRKDAVATPSRTGELESVSQSLLWNDIARDYARLGKVSVALEADKKISIPHFKVGENNYRALADAEAGNLREAVSHLKQATPVNLDLLADLVQRLAHANDADAAVDSFNLLSHLLETSPGHQQHLQRFSTQEKHPEYLSAVRAVGGVQAATRTPEKAFQWAKKLDTAEERVYGLVGVAERIHDCVPHL